MKLLINTILILSAFFFISCNDKNTTTPIVTDIKSLTIDNGNISSYSTDAPIKVSATVTFMDGTTDTATLATWKNSDYEVMSYFENSVWGGRSNGGDANLSIEFDQYTDTIEVNFHKLTSFFISSDEITTTGDFILEAKGNFENGESNRTIVKNIVWTADNGADISVEDDVVTITIESGDTNVTATMFSETDSNSSISPVSIVYSVE